ncbi:alpha/beta fold hydrolase [Streptomyces smyrnaeus]|uniref:alpha/beta fold hydrolase n=1 Tax=Streptomyces TaxID=1883 RepID=UPI000C174ADD|nr:MULTISPECIES: alpha/beta hydrolase [unclassified Streptomyces]MBQ0867199.1 alpha/beta hydrolase [Streptomyces sp. RK75]MBQ1121540.1 alpha/beta hydrolase [Streptomyces sp. B15]MBQ1162590.1 alpha/beta hydrolase [Streptomyces sp. A73]
MSSTEQPGAPASAARTAAPHPSLTRSRVGEQETLRTVSLPGLTLAVRGRRDDGEAPEKDSRPAALYVHGLGGSSLNWSALMRHLAPDVRGEAIDLPGFGDSPPPDNGDYSVSGHARAVIRYLDSCGHAPVHLLGNSLGGAVTTRVAAVRPDLVRTLTLVSPALPEIPPQRTAWPTAMLAIPGIASLFCRLTRDWPAERRTGGVLGLCYGDPARVSPEDFAAAVEEYARRAELPYFWDAMVRSTRGIVDAYTLGGQHALWRQAERVLAPTLLVYGGRDQLVAFRMARRAAAAFRDSRLLTLPDAGHVAMMEYPEIVAGAVRELIDDADTATQRSDDSAAGAGRQAPATPEGD